MEMLNARQAIADIFEANGFTLWAKEAAAATDPQQIKRLAIRAVNTSPDNQRATISEKLITLLK